MPDYATFYVPIDFEMDAESIAKLTSIDMVSINRVGSSSAIIELDGLVLKINKMDGGEVSSHLRGFSNYVLSFQLKFKIENVEHILKKISETRSVIGCVIEPGFDEEAVAGQLLSNFALNTGALIFTQDRVVDSDGTILL